MKITIGNKLGIQVGILLVLILLLTLISFSHIKYIGGSLHEIVEVEEPECFASYEMSKNLTCISFSILGYLHDNNIEHLENIKKYQANFEQYLNEYNKFKNGDDEETLAQEIEKYYTQFIVFPDKIINSIQRKKELFEIKGIENTGRIGEFRQSIHAAESVISENIERAACLLTVRRIPPINFSTAPTA